MNIIFKMTEGNDEDVKIIDKSNGQVVGRIFTPSGTMEDKEGAIQVCGFDDCFDLWGCGIFGDDKGNPKKDIQLLFNENSTNKNELLRNILLGTDCCEKCFYKYDKSRKCKCDDLRVKSLKEIILDKIEWKSKDGS